MDSKKAILMLGLLAMVLISSVMSQTSTDPNSESVEQRDLNDSKDGGSNGGGDSSGNGGHDKGGGIYNRGGEGYNRGGDDKAKPPN